MEIMKLIPTGKDYLWGGTRLREEYGKKIDLTPLAETWECSVHPDGPSYVANGTYKGNTLADVLKAHPEYLGTKVENGELPVLLSLLMQRKTCPFRFILVMTMQESMKATTARRRCGMSLMLTKEPA